MSHFIPKTQGMKADISESVRWQRVSERKWTTGRFHLLTLMLARRPMMEVQGRMQRYGRVESEEGQVGHGGGERAHM